MDDDTRRARSPASGTAVGELRAVMEQVSLLWEREGADESAVVVSASQLRVLGALERTPGLNLRELGAAVGSAASPLSRLCARLEAMGLVRRAPSAQSGREIELHLTRHATAHLQQLRERRERALAALLETMPPSAVASLAEGLAGLHLALDAHLHPPGDAPAIRSA